MTASCFASSGPLMTPSRTFRTCTSPLWDREPTYLPFHALASSKMAGGQRWEEVLLPEVLAPHR